MKIKSFIKIFLSVQGCWTSKTWTAESVWIYLLFIIIFFILSEQKQGHSSYLTACHFFFCPIAIGSIGSSLSLLCTEPPGVGPPTEGKNLNNQSGELATRVSHVTELPEDHFRRFGASTQNDASAPAGPSLILPFISAATPEHDPQTRENAKFTNTDSGRRRPRRWDSWISRQEKVNVIRTVPKPI